MPKIAESPAERTANAKRAIALRCGRPEEAHQWRVEFLRARAGSFRAEADRLETEAAQLLASGAPVIAAD